MVALYVALAFAPPAPLTADQIMNRVVEKQEASDRERSRFLYRQNLKMKLIRANRKLAREENYEYTVAPTDSSFEKKLESFSGKYEKDGTFVSYDKPGHEYKDVDIDGDLISDLADDLTNESKTRDGIARDLFPLSRDQLPKYAFELVGEREVQGRKSFHLRFHPKDREDFCWKGEAFIDTEDFHPVMLNTELSRRIPMAVQLLLGVNLKQMGFQLTYQRVAPGVWFPVSYGTEFFLKVLFLYKRTITMSLVNSDFRRVTSDSTVRFGEPVTEDPLVK
jgi:hypothetical protein